MTAWLRVPLDWFHSGTFAHFPDETHASIKRSFYTPASSSALPPIRRQFCGFCGTHLTAWNEGDRNADYLNVTLGSLLDESLSKLETLRLYSDLDSEGDSENDGLVKDDRGRIDEDTHIPTNETDVGGADGPPAESRTQRRQVGPHSMSGRGMPYFEEMVENSRLGRIKRQRGGHTSTDGTSMVQWEVVEIGGDDEIESASAVGVGSGHGNKRLRVGS